MTGIVGSTSCPWCQAAQRITTLGRFGNRCQQCFADYCAEGIGGGSKGFLGGAADTDQQREMRARLKANRPTGHAMTTSQDEVAAREAAKAIAARAVAQV